jgi:osmotically-inducible protein OsmY
LSDDEIAQAIETELAIDPAVAAHNIDVLVTAGIANLSGKVDNILAKERAVEVSRSVKGVRGVVDRIIVRPIPRPDDEILNAIENALLLNPATDSFEVRPYVENGVVILIGQVDSWQGKELAAMVAKQVHGVVELKNKIVVNIAEERSDREMAEEIREILRWDVRVDDALIDVAVENGNVTLFGGRGQRCGESASSKRCLDPRRTLG